jgi:hypothetical protein
VRVSRALLLALLVAGCREELSTLPVIPVQSLQEIERVAFGDTTYFDTCYLVRLETTAASLVGEVSDLELFNDRIYIFDKKTTSIHVFDKNGRFLHDVSKQGRAPGEYTSLSAFHIDASDSTVNLVDYLAKAVHKYDLSGNYLSTVKHDNKNMQFVKHFVPAGEGEFFCYSKTNWVANNIFSIVDAGSYALKRELHAYPVATPESTYSLFPAPFHRYKDRIIFAHPFSDTLSVYDGREVKPYMIIKNRANASHEMIKRLLEENRNDYGRVLMRLRDRYNLGLSTFFENDRFIICELFWEILQPTTIIWDKKKNAGELVIGLSLPDFSTYRFAAGNTLIFVWANHDISSFRARSPDDEEEPGERYDELRAQLETYDDNENPALLFYVVKEH